MSTGSFARELKELLKKYKLFGDGPKIGQTREAFDRSDAARRYRFLAAVIRVVLDEIDSDTYDSIDARKKGFFGFQQLAVAALILAQEKLTKTANTA